MENQVKMELSEPSIEIHTLTHINVVKPKPRKNIVRNKQKREREK